MVDYSQNIEWESYIPENQLLPDNDFVSASCQGEKCSLCGRNASYKIQETIMHDDPFPMRHPFTAYICKKHFYKIMNV